jgi:hypothetical protein
MRACVRNLLKFVLAVALLLVLAGCLTSIAYGHSNRAAAPTGLRIEGAGTDAAPRVVFFGNAYGSITPGDLFHLDATGEPAVFTANLYLTNPAELTHYLRYLILKVGAYYWSEDGRWENISPENDDYLTLQNSTVKFWLSGGTRYCIRVDAGDYYSYPARPGISNEVPHFYLTVDAITGAT